ncbi:hypothetical protein [Marinomonas transparens]|uniref:Uncharacterized protein n=1 Tax=Marinomonas transparens TaxID=2795388 RepID=A0A934MXF5_9GAMM|nr:hypothetical protein [Marinomonas transparens]MBJ7539259.1 hypothetical protein [Marinomonas transparens]
MAISKGFIQCPERHCSEVAEVWQAGGKRSTLYTKCPACGTNQGSGLARQKHLSESLKVSREEVETPAEKPTVSDTEENAAIPTQNAASSVSEDTDPIPKKKPIDKPKDMPTAPPVLLGVLALLAAVITAIFATRKPKGQTA